MPKAPKTHRPRATQTKRTEQRGTRQERGYDNTWNDGRGGGLSNAYKREHPLCEECEKDGIAEPVHEVDHIIPVRVRPDLRLEWDNLMSLCRTHHALKTEADKRLYGS